MSCNLLDSLQMDQLAQGGANPTVGWIWAGYLARGNVTLLTSIWKAGKTTLVTGLLQSMGAGGEFLNRQVVPGKALVVSEEPRALWAVRVHANPIGPHARLLARPFIDQPTKAQWNEFVQQAIAACQDGKLDLLIVDTLASFLPGYSDSDPGAIRAMIRPLQRLADAGAAVLILHHPRKEPSPEGSTARGHGGLLALADIILELRGFPHAKADDRRRRLIGRSRHAATPRELAYRWESERGPFTAIEDPRDSAFADNWEHLRGLLARYRSGISTLNMIKAWPEEQGRPSESTLLRWLHRAMDEKLVRREGAGGKTNPFRYRLPNKDDEYWDRGELPPLKPLPR